MNERTARADDRTHPEQSEYDRDDKKAAPKGVRSGAEGGGAPK